MNLAAALAGSVLVVVSAAVLVSWTLRRRLLRRGELSHSLGLAVLKVQLPRSAAADGQRLSLAEAQERIAVMEQVFAQLGAIREGAWHSWLYGRPFMSFELAVPHVGQEALFFCAVPRRFAVQVEKLLTGLYPDAHVEAVPDYTVFYPGGAAAAALALGRSRFLPLRTYRDLAADPLVSLTNAFSKVANEGEGLAFQVVAAKAPRSWNHRLAAVVGQLRSGKPLGKALFDSQTHLLVEAMKFFRTAKPADPSAPAMVNDSLIRLIEGKAQKPLFSCNIRLVASAPTAERAEQLLQSLAVPLTQFGNEETNHLNVRRATGRRLRAATYQFSFRLPERSSAVILGTDELASLIHLPNAAPHQEHVATVSARAAAAPVNLPAEGLLLGINDYRGEARNVFMLPEDRARHLYIIGQTGTGKSVLLRNLVIQDIERGEGVCFIDPHGEAIHAILEHIPPARVRDVIYFNPGDVERPMGLNMLEYDPAHPEQKTFITNELLAIFNKLYDMKTVGGPMFEQYFRNATSLVMDDPASGSTLIEINRVFTDKAFRDLKLSRTADPLVRTFWRDVAEKAGGEASLQNVVPYISSKFDSFLSNEIVRPIVAQERSAFRFRQAMDEGKILLINLSKGRLGEINSALLGLTVVGKILMAAFSRVDQPEDQRRPFYLYIDEFQNVTTDSIESILSEARKYRLALTVAHQFTAQLSEGTKKAVFGNVGSMAAFRVGADDAELLEKHFAPTLAAADLMNVDNYRAYLRLLVHGKTVPPFGIRVPPPTSGSSAVAQAARDFSRQTYGRDRAEVEAEVAKKFEAIGVR